MTKTITEKWKDMDLADENLYYWRMPNGEVRIMTKMGVYSYKLCYDGGEINILAPVPRYEEYNRLKQKAERADYLDEKLKYFTPEESYFVQLADKKLAIATKALEIYSAPTGVGETAYNALKEIKEVK